MGNQSPRRGILRTLGSLIAVGGLTAVAMVALQAPEAGPGGDSVANAEWCVDENGDRYWALDCGDGGPGPGPGPDDPGDPGPDEPQLSESRTVPDCNKYPDGAIFGPGEPGFEECLQGHQDCVQEDPNDDGVGDPLPGGGYSNDEFQASFVHTRTSETAPWGPWEYSANSCGPDEPPPSPEEIAERFRTDLPMGEPSFQPENRTLVGLKTAFQTELERNPIDETYQFGTYTVNVHGEATSFLWHFGDGEEFSTPNQGRPYPLPGWEDVTHEYEAPDTYNADVDVTFEGTFTIGGGAPQALPAITIDDGPAVPVEVLQGDPRLTR